MFWFARRGLLLLLLPLLQCLEQARLHGSVAERARVLINEHKRPDLHYHKQSFREIPFLKTVMRIAACICQQGSCLVVGQVTEANRSHELHT